MQLLNLPKVKKQKKKEKEKKEEKNVTGTMSIYFPQIRSYVLWSTNY